MKISIRFLLIISLISCFSLSASELISWELTDNSDNITYAEQFLTQSDKPGEAEKIKRSADVIFSQDEVLEKHLEITYFPRSIDIENNGTAIIYLNSKTQQLRIKSVVSISSKGKIKQITPSALRILDTNTVNAFNDIKEVVLTIPALEEGSLSVVDYEISTDRRVEEFNWSKSIYTESRLPIQLSLVTANWQGSEEMRWANQSDSMNCTENNRTLICQGQDIAAFEGDNNIYWRDEIGIISLGGLASWNEVVTLISAKMDSAENNMLGIEHVLKTKIVNNGIESAIYSALEFAARDIRYVSVSELGNAITPHEIAKTLENRYGDCKDKSVLLKALLDNLSIKSYLALVATNYTDASRFKLPSLDRFDHLVVCFELNGKQYCVDPTDFNTNWQYTPSWIQNKVILPLKKGSQPQNMINSQYRWKFETDTHTIFTDDGGQVEDQKRYYIGEYASYYRNTLHEKTANAREEWLTEQYKNVVSELGEKEFEVQDIESMGDSVNINSRVVYSAFLDVTEDLTYTENDAWLRKELQYLKLTNKKHDEFVQGILVETSMLFDTNNIWKLKYVSTNLELNHKFGSLNRLVTKISDNRMKVDTKLEIASQVIALEDIEAFNGFINKLLSQSSINFQATK
ncbi:Putative uncharacterized protein [Moritella viscosa]|uniref:DUF3857 domain-containing protein n=1 Tax=Moritella viscosa TaxID=80854 RepID=UPI00091F3D1B|nr:DUF3857 domain-containing protein [Moritella viscosa]SGY81413.1 Putative uncharacterized protein [Moritella viscosa]